MSESDRTESGLSGATPEEILDQLCDEISLRFERGEHPRLSEYVDRHPGLADELAEVFPTLRMIQKAGRDEPPPLPGVELTTLTELGEFTLLRELGRGGMGVVYEAEQKRLRRRVAIKILGLAPGVVSERALLRFRSEACAAAKLHHPNIVPVYDVGEANGLYYYTMQLILGQGLDRVLDELRTLRRMRGGERLFETSGYPSRPPSSLDIASGLEREGSSRVHTGDPSGHRGDLDTTTGEEASSFHRNVARIGIQAARALAYAHENGVVHRDVKPSNLVLDLHQHVWVTDFGLARTEGDAGITASGDAVGTLRYMGPERFSGGASPRSDIYSLGVTLYELLALRPPFEGGDRAALVHSILHETPAPLRRVDRRIPRDLETIVFRAIERDERHRYESANALAEDLERFVDSRPILARRSSRVRRVWLAARRNPLAAFLAVSVLALLTVVAATATRSAIRSRSMAHESLVTAARHIVSRGEPGHRLASLEAIRRAAAIDPSSELRDLAVAALSRPDFELTQTWHVPGEDPTPLCVHVGKGVVCSVRRRDGRASADSWEAVVSDASGAALSTFPVPDSTGRKTTAIFSPDGELLCTHDSEARKRLELRRWREDLVISTIEGAFAFRAFSADSRFLFGRESAVGMRVFETESGKERHDILPAGHAYYSIATTSGDRIALARRDEAVVDLVALDPEGGGARTLTRLPVPRKSMHMAWSRDGAELVLSRGAELWRLRVGIEPSLFRLEAHQSPVMSLHIDGGIAAADAWDGFVRAWSFDSTGLLFRTRGYLRAFTGTEILVGSIGRIDVYARRDPGVCRAFRSHEQPRGIPCSAFDSTERWLLTGGRESLHVWDAASGRLAGVAAIGELSRVAFDRQSSSVLTVGSKGVISWPWRESRVPRAGADRIRIHLGPPTVLLRSALGSTSSIDTRSRTVVASLTDGTWIIPVDEPARMRKVETSGPWAHFPAISPDGRWIAAGQWLTSAVTVWNAASGERVARIPTGLSRAHAWFSPDSDHLVVSSARIGVFEVGSWHEVASLERATGVHVPGAVAFAPEGDTIVYSHSSTEMRLARFPSLETLLRWNPSGDARAFYSESIQLSPSGSLVAVAHRDPETTRIWDLRRVRRHLDRLGLDWDDPVTVEEAPPEGGSGGVELVTMQGALSPDVEGIRSHVIEGRLDEALAELAELDSELSALAETQYWRGRASAALGRFEDALAAYDRALAVRSDWIAPVLERSLILRELGRQVDAVRSARRAVSLTRGGVYESTSRMQLAWVMVTPKVIDASTEAAGLEALEVLRHVTEIAPGEPGFAELRRARALASVRAGRVGEARSVYADVVARLESGATIEGVGLERGELEVLALTYREQPLSAEIVRSFALSSDAGQRRGRVEEAPLERLRVEARARDR